MTDEVLNEAIAKTIAAQILGALSDERRAAFLEKSLTKALKDWSVTSAIEKVVAARALEVAAELAKEEDWTLRITDATRDGFEIYIQKIPKAIVSMLLEEMHGKDQPYGRCGSILKHLKNE